MVTTPSEVALLNDTDSFDTATVVIDRVPGLTSRTGKTRQLMVDRRLKGRAHTRPKGDPREIRDWTWTL
jgi:phosphoketolase